MPLLTSSERSGQLFERVFRHLKVERKAGEAGEGPPVPRALTIAISREAGANGHLVARAVAERLHWPVYDRELLKKVAEDMGLRPALLETVDEKKTPWLQEFLETFVSAPAVSERSYARYLLETLASLVDKGECVILGRGAAQLLPEASTLRVRLVGRLEDRVEVIRQRHQCTREAALSWVEQTDRDRARFVQGIFGKDPAALQDYDLVISSSRFSVAESADLIVEALRRLQARVGMKLSQATAR